jgi:hypothetical protein
MKLAGSREPRVLAFLAWASWAATPTALPDSIGEAARRFRQPAIPHAGAGVRFELKR